MKAALERLSTRDREAVDEFRQEMLKNLKSSLVSIKLFGSKARGDDAPDSDIDIAVIVKRYSARLENKLIDLAFEVNLKYGVYISPFIIARGTFRHPVWRFSPFLKNIQTQGVLL